MQSGKHEPPQLQVNIVVRDVVTVVTPPTTALSVTGCRLRIVKLQSGSFLIAFLFMASAQITLMALACPGTKPDLLPSTRLGRPITQLPATLVDYLQLPKSECSETWVERSDALARAFREYRCPCAHPAVPGGKMWPFRVDD
jgi:hypothetical protein